MSNIRFNLGKNPNGPHSIFLRFVYKKKNFKISVKEKIDIKDWDFKRQLPKRRYFAYMPLSTRLNKIKQLTEYILIDIKNKSSFSHKELKELLVKKIHGKEIEKTFFNHLDDFIEYKTDKIKKVSLKRYRLLKNKLLEYDANLTFDSIDIIWYDKWISKLEKENYSINYINTITKGLKTFLRYSFEYGYTKNVKWNVKKFNYSGKAADAIYLNIDKLKKLYYHNYPRFSLRNAVNLFMIGSFTGLRFADMVRINPQRDIKIKGGVKLLKIKTSKTGEIVEIPIHPIVGEIIFNNKFYPIANQILNKKIKIAAKEAGLTELVQLEYNKGGKSYLKTFFEYEKITTHTARRSFATNAYKMNIPVAKIMKITGHKTEKQFFDYIKISKTENAIQLSKHPFFNSDMKVV